MRGSDERTGSLFSFVDLEERVPAKHPLRKIRQIVNDALATLDTDFSRLYAAEGRPSIAPEKLLRASLLQAFYAIRSERQLLEQRDYNLLLRWFVGLSVDDPVWVPTVFTKNRDRLLDADVAAKSMAAVLAHREVNTAAKFCFIGHALAENRHGLIVQADSTTASSRAGREVALAMIERHSPDSERRLTLGADKAYDPKGFVDECKRCAETLFFDCYRQHKREIKVEPFSTRTGRACVRRMAASCRTSSCRRSRVNRLRSTARAVRHGRSAMSTTSSKVSSGR